MAASVAPVYLQVQLCAAAETETSPVWTSWRGSCCWCDQGNKSGGRQGEKERGGVGGGVGPGHGSF